MAEGCDSVHWSDVGSATAPDHENHAVNARFAVRGLEKLDLTAKLVLVEAGVRQKKHV